MQSTLPHRLLTDDPQPASRGIRPSGRLKARGAAGRTAPKITVCLLVVAGVHAVGSPSAGAVEMDGYTEPVRTIEVATDESGTIEEVLVREGQAVVAGQPLVRLNSEIHQALLAIAEQNALAEGRLEAARAELALRQDRLRKLEPLRMEGHARQEEVDRAAAEVAMAEANVRSAQEDLVTRRLEHNKIRTQIARRTVRAPLAGVVVVLPKDPGEFVAPNNPHVATIVQLDRLLANFTLSDLQAQKLSLDQPLHIRFSSGMQTVGQVDYISPVTNPESGTVLVKLRIDNRQGRFRSGERCTVRIGE